MNSILSLLNLFLVFQSIVFPGEKTYENPETLNIGIEQANMEVQTENVEFLIEDINEAGSLTKGYMDEDNILHTVQIEASPTSDISSSNISLTRLANKTYTIRYTKDANVSSAFKIDILSNKIQRAHSSSVTLYKGTLSDSKLVRISSTKAQQTFNQKLLFGTRKYSITATVSNGKIVVHAIP